MKASAFFRDKNYNKAPFYACINCRLSKVKKNAVNDNVNTDNHSHFLMIIFETTSRYIEIVGIKKNYTSSRIDEWSHVQEKIIHSFKFQKIASHNCRPRINLWISFVQHVKGLYEIKIYPMQHKWILMGPITGSEGANSSTLNM